MLAKYRRLVPCAARQWPMLVLIVLCTTALSAVAVLQPWPLKVLIDHALGDAGPPAILTSLLKSLSVEPDAAALIVAAALATLLLSVLSGTLNFALGWLWTCAGQRMVYDLAAQLFARLQRLSLLFHSRRSVGDSLDRLATDTFCAYTIAEGVLVTPLQQILTVAAVGWVAWSLDPQLTAVALVTAPALAASARLFGRGLKRRAGTNREAQARLTSFVHQTLSSVPLVQVFAAEDANRRSFERLAAEAVATAQRSVLLNKLAGLSGGLSGAIGAALVLYFGGRRVLAGALSIGGLVVFLAYLKTMQGAFEKLFQSYTKLKAADASLDRVLEVLDTRELVSDSPQARPLPAAAGRPRGHVQFESVTFGYEPGRAVLEEITLDVRPGETVAIVGPTGAGKSTLVSLIPRFFDPWQGRVLLDGHDAREVQLASLRAQVALVLQEPFLLPLTIAENIAYGRPGASRDEIQAAAVAARAHEFIERLPQGYETVIGERGATLSGGEKQRLSIARALLKDAAVVILDEPTSSLDVHTEAALVEALEGLVAGRTTFVIAHRLSTIRRADRIAVLEAGRITETGTHGELLAAERLYHRLHSLQFAHVPQEVAR